jgi:fructose-1,6-bisphosphatase/inositol monophosphatase family enzyme
MLRLRNLAAGCIDICVEPDLRPYDIIPIIPVVEKAGGVVTRFDGRRAETGGAVLLSATPELQEKALAIFNG